MASFVLYWMIPLWSHVQLWQNKKWFVAVLKFNLYTWYFGNISIGLPLKCNYSAPCQLEKTNHFFHHCIQSTLVYMCFVKNILNRIKKYELCHVGLSLTRVISSISQSRTYWQLILVAMLKCSCYILTHLHDTLTWHTCSLLDTKWSAGLSPRRWWWVFLTLNLFGKQRTGACKDDRT